MRIILFVLLLAFSSLLSAQEKDKDFELLMAAYENNLPLLRTLLDDSASVNTKTEDGVTPLMYAAQNGNDTMVKLLINYGANVNEKPSDGFTALISACLFNHLDAAITLIENNADINATNMYGATPLMIAAAYGYYIITDMLLYYGAEKEIPDDYGNTPLHIASVQGFYDILNLLIEKGSSLNTKDNDGHTPLISAVINDNHKAIEILLQNNADVDIQNNKGYTALMIALRNRNDSVVEILKNKKYNISLENKWQQNTAEVALLNKNKCFYKCNNQKNLRYYMPYLSKISLNTGLTTAIKDIMYFNSIGLYDVKYGFHLNVGHSSRIAKKKVLCPIEANSFYQFNEKRSFIFTKLSKDFQLGYKLYKEYGINTGISSIYTYGHIEGTKTDVENRYLWAPSLGMYFTSDFFTTSLTYEYLNFKTLHLSPHKLTLGVRFDINIRRNTKYQKKNIYWVNL